MMVNHRCGDCGERLVPEGDHRCNIAGLTNHILGNFTSHIADTSKKVKTSHKLTQDQQIRALALELAIASYVTVADVIDCSDIILVSKEFEDYIREGRKG